ncbi:hypothetical protein N7491_005183 [Penicillium cf. griseofulvum]|uniref:Uncharacterized protein n=1 Tax=Penicillium cf. griseofulvum TaxID=2972120 RepID=A0A9W9J391_9EURO|nr:hypothetical protein N7472_007876 [Penicillium cf. griseofulvum]KAJ5434588.1 hypothetical protein N7491_005183 [Penicillium cf. griseofulvum]KAJ5452417.1 hypothetical protein N7445_000600 [Penicillium cf. griseofulvum]
MASYTSYSNPDSLTELSSIIERTLIDTSRLFRKSGSMPSRIHLQRSIPLYHDSFQNALDNLSEQIFIAKAFLERDYEALKATSTAPQPIEDVAMSDVKQQVELDIQPPLTEKVEMDTELEPTMLKSEAAIATNQSVPAEIKPDTQSGDDVVVKKEGDNNTVPDQSFPGPNEDLTFDSVLNDTGGTNDFGLSLDFNDDDMGNQAFLSGSNFTAPGATGADKLSTQHANTSDVPAGGGAFDMELQKTEGGDNNFLGQGNSGDDFMGPAESNFDDLFMDTDNFGENGGDFNQLEGDSLMNVNELDDNWFN